MDRLKERGLELDKADKLSKYRDLFHMPQDNNAKDYLYFTGNSLGLQPKSTADYLKQELADWAKFGVEGHLYAKNPWLPYHEFLTEKMAKVVGAKPSETVVMNSLTANLHFMMVSFYRPNEKRRKILMEYSPFPSDIYAVKSQVRFHGGDPETDIVFLKADEGETVSDAQIKMQIDQLGDELALALIGGVNYYTGQFYPLKSIVDWGHQVGAMVGFDMAHGAGNVQMNLHETGCDFAVWCSYKYLNSGPGSLSGCFVHERHHGSTDLPRFEGWWGQNKQRRFLMEDEFQPIDSVEAWQLSNPPILSMAAILASLDIFDEAGMEALTEKSRAMGQYFEELVDASEIDGIEMITPREASRRGCQISLVFKGRDKSFYEKLIKHSIIADWREPNVIRVAPVPLYNSFMDIYHLMERIGRISKN